jgi:quercetin dioxygenase-like cupin family protein
MLLALALALAGPVATGDTAPAWKIAGGKGTATLLHNGSTGATAAAMDLLVLEAGAAVPPHKHDTSVEMLYVIEGTVDMVIGGEKVSAKAGDAIYVPANVEHQATATSGLRCVQVYVGPGPEQRFMQGERAR